MLERVVVLLELLNMGPGVTASTPARERAARERRTAAAARSG